MNYRRIKRGVDFLKKNGIKKSVNKLYRNYKIKKSLKNVSENYNDYVVNNQLSEKEIKMQLNTKFEYSPKISIVIPLYNTNILFLKELIDSIVNQTYSNYELCLADGSDNNDDILNFLSGIDNEKIKYIKLEKNFGISENTNKAIQMSSGEYIAFCDHDDILEKNALFEVVAALNKDKEIDFIYTDEDIIENGKRKNPHFKPDYSPDLLTSYNYICHLCVVKRELIEKVGMLDSKFNGAQDYDFVLRATEESKKIAHISKILYHWRSYELSTAGNSQSKNYVYEAGKKAIEEHLKRKKINGNVVIEDEPGRYKIEYDIIGNPKVSIVIPNKDNKDDLKKCIDSILKSSYSNYEIIIVENNSKKQETFEYYDYLNSNYKNIKVVYYKEKRI